MGDAVKIISYDVIIVKNVDPPPGGGVGGCVGVKRISPGGWGGPPRKLRDHGYGSGSGKGRTPYGQTYSTV